MPLWERAWPRYGPAAPPSGGRGGRGRTGGVEAEQSGRAHSGQQLPRQGIPASGLGATICNELKDPGICMMGDFYHMAREEASDRDAFVAAGNWLHHVHLASRRRWLPGQDDRSFVEGFRGLKQIGYHDYCSLECGVKKGTKPEEAIRAAFRSLEQQWKEATV